MDPRISSLFTFKELFKITNLEFGYCPACWAEKNQAAVTLLTTLLTGIGVSPAEVVRRIQKEIDGTEKTLGVDEHGCFVFNHPADEEDPCAAMHYDVCDIDWGIERVFFEKYSYLEDEWEIEVLRRSYREGCDRHNIPLNLVGREIAVYWRGANGNLMEIRTRVGATDYGLDQGLTLLPNDNRVGSPGFVLHHNLRENNTWSISLSDGCCRETPEEEEEEIEKDRQIEAGEREPDPTPTVVSVVFF